MAGVWTRNYTNLLACCFGMEHKDSWTPTTLSVQPSDYSNDTIYFRYSSSAWYPCKGINTNGSGTGSNIYAINYMACTSVSLPFSGVYGRNPQAYGASGTNCRCEIGIQCGSGSLGSANIYDAYDLNTPITSGLSMSAPVPEVTTTYDSTYHKYTKTTSFGISNVSSNNISISEIGLYKELYLNVG